MPRRRRRSPARRRTTKRRSTARTRRAGFAPVKTVAGVALGASAAIGGAAVLQMAANAAKLQLPEIVREYAPLAGAGTVAALTMLAPKFRELTVPAVIGGAIIIALQKFGKGNGGAGRYNQLRGAGNVARVLANNARGAGNVARVLMSQG